MERNEEIESYKSYLEQRELSQNTIQLYVRQAELLLEFLGENKISKSVMLDYKRHLDARCKKAASKNLYIVAANNYLKYLGQETCMVRTEKLHRQRSLKNVISMDEYRKILTYAKESGREKYYYIIRTLASTGMRVGELRFLTVEALEQESFCVENKGKIRELYLPEKLSAELMQYCRKHGITRGAIFCGNRGEALQRVSVYKMLVKLADMAGVEKQKAHPHSYRHFFALIYMNRYADLTELADLLGHSSLETTRIYTTTTAEEKRRKLDTLGI